MEQSKEIIPFRIDIPQTELDDLKDRLSHTRWPDNFPDVDWDYGVPPEYLKGIAAYWESKYDWRKQEEYLNQYPQFTTRIDGQTIHFLHVRSPESGAMPLIITHGWPGSFLEFIEAIGPLTDPRTYGGDPADAFHVVIPSLPGFGFSGPTNEMGWNTGRVAKAWAELMNRLGYDQYGAQGGDTGSMVSAELGQSVPERVIGLHVNGLKTFPSGDPAESIGLTEIEQERFDKLSVQSYDTNGYAIIQATRPQTLAYGLTDSPIGVDY